MRQAPTSRMTTAFAFAAMLIGAMEPSRGNAEPAARPVIWTTVSAVRGDDPGLTGVVQPRVQSNLSFRVLGRIVARRVTVGDLVRKGDVIAQIDPLTLRLALQGAEADLRNANAQLRNAVSTAKRRRSLVGVGGASTSDVELAEQALKVAQATANRAEANRDRAREQFGYAELRAEFDGIVTATSAEPGQTVTAGQIIASIALLDQRDVVVDVPEAWLPAVRAATHIDVAMQLDPSIKEQGTLRELTPEADARTRTFRMRVGLDGAREVYRFGSVVRTTFSGSRPVGVVVLPASAIFQRDGAPHVWIVDPDSGVVALRRVRLVPHAAGAETVSVGDGVRSGERVVVAGVTALSEGQRVRLGEERWR
jgi:RND family efflux transporter MFP subunit